MKKRFLNQVGKVLAPAALIVAMAFSPVAALAANHGGGHAGGSGGGHSFAAPSRGNVAMADMSGLRSMAFDRVVRCVRLAAETTTC